MSFLSIPSRLCAARVFVGRVATGRQTGAKLFLLQLNKDYLPCFSRWFSVSTNTLLSLKLVQNPSLEIVHRH